MAGSDRLKDQTVGRFGEFIISSIHQALTDEISGLVDGHSKSCQARHMLFTDSSQFEVTNDNGPSSSVTDLFDSFRSASEFLINLGWPDEHQLANFATRLAKVSST